MDEKEVAESKHYLSNKEMHQELRIFYDTGVFTEKLQNAIILMANKLSYRYNFSSYSFREEMVSDAILCMTKAVINKKFSIEKKNVFSYYTTVAYNAMVQRIIKEKRHQETKQALIDKQNITDIRKTDTINRTWAE